MTVIDIQQKFHHNLGCFHSTKHLLSTVIVYIQATILIQKEYINALAFAIVITKVIGKSPVAAMIDCYTVPTWWLWKAHHCGTWDMDGLKVAGVAANKIRWPKYNSGNNYNCNGYWVGSHALWVHSTSGNSYCLPPMIRKLPVTVAVQGDCGTV